jgi:large repetitive protein
MAGNGEAAVSFSPSSSDGGSPITSYTVTATDSTNPLNGGQTASGSGSPITVTGLTNGDAYTFTVVATNGVGNSPASSPSAAVTPATVPSAPQDVSGTPSQSAIVVNWSAPASDGGNAITSYTVSATPALGGTPVSVTAGPSATSATVPGLTDGTQYDVTVAATNGVGTGPAADAADNPVTPSANWPTFTSASSAGVAVTKHLAMTLTATGSPTPTISLASSLPSWLTFTANSGTGTAKLAGTAPKGSGGLVNLVFKASNSAGTATQDFTLSVLSVSSPSTASFSEGQAGSFTITTTGALDPTITESGTLPHGLTLVSNGDGTATLSGTPTVAGDHNVTLTATAGSVKTTQKLAIDVGEGPAITTPSTVTIAAGQEVRQCPRCANIQIKATGTPAPSITESGTLPSWLTFTPGTKLATLTGNAPADSGGTYNFTVTATNSSGTVSQNFTLSVVEISSSNSATFTVGQAGSFTVTTVGGVTPPLVSEVGTLPRGVKYHDNGDGTGTLSGTPDSGTAGTYNVTFSAPAGKLKVTQSFTLTVDS